MDLLLYGRLKREHPLLLLYDSPCKNHGELRNFVLLLNPIDICAMSSVLWDLNRLWEADILYHSKEYCDEYRMRRLDWGLARKLTKDYPSIILLNYHNKSIKKYCHNKLCSLKSI